MKFSQKLKLLREERNMNITEFATLLGTSKQVISRYERGENTPKITTVAHYAKVLNVPLSYLMNDKTNTPEKLDLSEGEKMWLELYHKLSNETREMLITSLSELDSLTPEQRQRMAERMGKTMSNYYTAHADEYK